jgi:cytochrome c556
MALWARRVVAVLAVGGLAAAVVGGEAAADDKKKKEYTISEIMKKGHGAKGLLKGIGAEVKAGKWDEAKTDAALLKEFGEAIGTLKPEKGDEASWKKQTGIYKDNTAAVYEGVEAKDAKKAGDALKKIGGSCKSCHEAHKG